MKELKPCPFCGGEAEIDARAESTMYVHCTKCYSGTGSYFKANDAIEAWNTRANDTLEPKKVVSAERTCTTTEYPTGETWIICKSCNSCNFGWHVSIYDKPFSYCPNCGAKVVEQ